MRNVLLEAAEEGDLELVERLLDGGADVNMKTEVRSAHVSERFLFKPYVQLVIVQEMASILESFDNAFFLSQAFP